MPPDLSLDTARHRVVGRLVVDHVDFESLADLQFSEIRGISSQCEHPRVGPQQEAPVLRINRQDFPLDSITTRSVTVHRCGGNPVTALIDPPSHSRWGNRPSRRGSDPKEGEGYEDLSDHFDASFCLMRAQ
jgi:hypothetical protein